MESKPKYNLVMVRTNINGKAYAQLQTCADSNQAVEYASESEARAQGQALLAREHDTYCHYIVLFIDPVFKKLRKA